MKKIITKAAFWAISTMLGFMLVDLIRGADIDFFKAVLYGIIMGIVDFIFSIVHTKKNKNH